MNAALEEIRDAYEAENFDEARTLADAYVAGNGDEFVDHASKTIDECVAAVDVFRAAGMETARWQMETWILHRFAPQNIGGTYEPQIRLVAQ